MTSSSAKESRPEIAPGEPDGAGAAPGNPYDELPYVNWAYRVSHPDHLYTIATLFGLEAPPHRGARVLELGCGPGGNALSIADRFPGCEVVAVDASSVHIEQARAVRSAAGLDNLDLRCASILDLPVPVTRELGEFDYVIAHGVYSWVAPPVRERLLELCAGHLAAQGIVYLSYNALPGWTMLRVFREMMLYHTEHMSDLAEKAREGARLLRFLRDAQRDPDTPYARALAAETAGLEGRSVAYFVHDHLEADNTPSYLHEVVSAARAVGLDYLGDASLHTMFPTGLPERVRETLRGIGDVVRAEQYADFVLNRRFRKTLLCRSGRTPSWQLSPASLRDVALISRLRPERAPDSIDPTTDGEVSFSGSGRFQSRNRFISALLLTLAERAGQAVPYEVWADGVRRRLGEASAVSQAEARALGLVVGGVIEVAQPDEGYVTAPGNRPLASPLARAQAMHQSTCSNRRGEVVDLSPVERAVLRWLDGHHDAAALEARMRAEVAAGRIRLELGSGGGQPAGGGVELPDEALGTVLQKHLEATLDKFLRAALLVG